MDDFSRIKRSIRQIAGHREMLYVGRVKSVEGETCTVQFDDLTLSDVRLRAVVNGKESKMLITPACGSKPIFGIQGLPRHEPCSQSGRAKRCIATLQSLFGGRIQHHHHTCPSCCRLATVRSGARRAAQPRVDALDKHQSGRRPPHVLGNHATHRRPLLGGALPGRPLELQMPLAKHRQGTYRQTDKRQPLRPTPRRPRRQPRTHRRDFHGQLCVCEAQRTKPQGTG